MSGTYEGDIIRPLGLVTLYFGYAELEIDSLLECLSAFGKLDDPLPRLPVGQKLGKAREILAGLGSEKLDALRRDLDEAVVLFDRRNTLVHSAIFAGTSVLQSRVTGREQAVTPEALTSLADDIFFVKDRIRNNRQRILEPILEARQDADRL